MSSRERVLATINHCQPDRVPIDLGSTRNSSIHVSAYSRLRERLGCGSEPPRVLDAQYMTAWLETPVVTALGIDVLTVPRLTWSFGLRADRWQPWQLEDGTAVQMPANYHPEIEPDGTLLLYQHGEVVGRRSPENPFFDRVSDFAERGSLPCVDEMPMLCFSDEELAWRRGWAERLRADTDKALVGDFGAVLGRWGSYQQWLLTLASEPAYVIAYYERKIENLLTNMERYAHAVGGLIDVVWLGEDFGTQSGLMLSPRTFAELIAPHYRRLFDWVHLHTPWKILFHSCGGIYPIIGQLVDCGVDILNPVQANAAGMDPRRLKQEFGDRLVFWGGGIDTQTTLPFGSPSEVEAQVRERIELLGPGGGYVFAASHNIQADAPVDNLLSMFAAVHAHGHYHKTSSLEPTP